MTSAKLERCREVLERLLRYAANRHDGPRMNEKGMCKGCDAVRDARNLLSELEDSND